MARGGSSPPSRMALWRLMWATTEVGFLEGCLALLVARGFNG